jgi:hypothetical protein
MLGIPLEMQPTIKSSLWNIYTLEDFRRLLMDLEPGLRPNFVRKTAPTNATAPINMPPPIVATPATATPEAPLRNTYRATTTTLTQNSIPPNGPNKPCICGGMHWRRDCPNLSSPSK